MAKNGLSECIKLVDEIQELLDYCTKQFYCTKQLNAAKVAINPKVESDKILVVMRTTEERLSKEALPELIRRLQQELKRSIANIK